MHQRSGLGALQLEVTRLTAGLNAGKALNSRTYFPTATECQRSFSAGDDTDGLNLPSDLSSVHSGEPERSEHRSSLPPWVPWVCKEVQTALWHSDSTEYAHSETIYAGIIHFKHSVSAQTRKIWSRAECGSTFLPTPVLFSLVFKLDNIIDLHHSAEHSLLCLALAAILWVIILWSLGLEAH